MNEQKLRTKVGSVLAEKLVRNAVLGIQAEGIAPTRDLTAQMVRMIAAMRSAPKSVEEARLATETITRTLAEIEAGE